MADKGGKNTVTKTLEAILEKKPELVPLPPNKPGFRGYNPKPTFRKFNTSARVAGESFCILDGQTFNRHSKKNMMRHISVIQNSFIASQKGQSDLRLVIGKYEKKYGKLKELPSEKTQKPEKVKKTLKRQGKGFVSRDAPKK